MGELGKGLAGFDEERLVNCAYGSFLSPHPGLLPEEKESTFPAFRLCWSIQVDGRLM